MLQVHLLPQERNVTYLHLLSQERIVTYFWVAGIPCSKVTLGGAADGGHHPLSQFMSSKPESQSHAHTHTAPALLNCRTCGLSF